MKEHAYLLGQWLGPLVRGLRQQWQGSRFPGALSWWAGQLVDSLPHRLRSWLTQRDEPLPVRRENGTLMAYREGHWEGFTPGGGQAERCQLVLCPGQALLLTLTLPAATGADLAGALAYELDRYTPFAPEQVHYAFKRLPNPGEGCVTVALGVIRRDRLQTWLAELAALGLKPCSVDIAAAEDSAFRGLGLDLLPTTLRPPEHRWVKLNTALALATLCLSIAAAQFWLHNRQAALRLMEQEVAELREQAREAQGPGSGGQNDEGAGRYVFERRQSLPLLSSVLSELTACLPGDTWLSQLSVEADGQLGIGGQSPQAGSLPARLKSCPSIVAPQFQGLIQTDESSGKERFYLVAHLRKEEPHAAPNPDTP